MPGQRNAANRVGQKGGVTVCAAEESEWHMRRGNFCLF